MSASANTATHRSPFLTAYAGMVFAFIYLPIVVLVVYSFNRDGGRRLSATPFHLRLVPSAFR